MKFTFDQEWLEKHAEDPDLEIAAGSFSIDQLPPMGDPPSDSRDVEHEVAAVGHRRA